MKTHAIKTLIFIIQWAKFIQDFISSDPESGIGYTLEELKILFDTLIMSVFSYAVEVRACAYASKYLSKIDKFCKRHMATPKRAYSSAM